MQRLRGLPSSTARWRCNGATTITNANGTANGTPIGLSVENDAIIEGSGALTLENLTGQVNPTPFMYASTSRASVYTGAISGPGAW